MDDVEEIIDEEKRELLNVVIKCFGYYNGKALEKMSHYEGPWMKARRGLGADEKSHVVISKEDMREYFAKVKDKYNMINFLEIKEYSEELFHFVIGMD